MASDSGVKLGNYFCTLTPTCEACSQALAEKASYFPLKSGSLADTKLWCDNVGGSILAESQLHIT